MEFETTTQMDDLLREASNIRKINPNNPTSSTIKAVTDFAKKCGWDEEDISDFLSETGGLAELIVFLADSAEVDAINYMMRQR